MSDPGLILAPTPCAGAGIFAGPDFSRDRATRPLTMATSPFAVRPPPIAKDPITDMALPTSRMVGTPVFQLNLRMKASVAPTAWTGWGS